MKKPPDHWRDRQPDETTPPPKGWLACTAADLVPADIIRFRESVWRNKKKIGDRLISAEVLDPTAADVLGQWETAKPADGWVYLGGLQCEGDHPDEVLRLFRRKTGTIERVELLRKLWDDETARVSLVDVLAADE